MLFIGLVLVFQKCDHAAMYEEISDQNLELMRERLIQTVIWPSDDTNTEKIGWRVLMLYLLLLLSK